MANAALALLPVLLLLAALTLTDSFKLVRARTLLTALGWGAVAAGAAVLIQDALARAVTIPTPAFVRYVGPLTEETTKGLLIVLWIARGRVGFLVDATILGFAVGTGFAVVENVAFLRALGDAPPTLWMVRGLGTAVLHGATTSILAMTTKELTDRHPQRVALAWLPGWAAVVVVHSAFNHLLLPAAVATALMLTVLPLLVLWVFERSERATREWVGAGLDLDVELLRLAQSEQFARTRFGPYLRQLRARFPGVIVADMFCLLRIDLELAVQAKARLVARKAGIEIPADLDLGAALAEREYLQRAIGRAGLLALEPLRVTSRRDDWHRHLLAQAGAPSFWQRGRRPRA